jgi:hypothetical protein
MIFVDPTICVYILSLVYISLSVDICIIRWFNKCASMCLLVSRGPIHVHLINWKSSFNWKTLTFLPNLNSVCPSLDRNLDIRWLKTHTLNCPYNVWGAEFAWTCYHFLVDKNRNKYSLNLIKETRYLFDHSQPNNISENRIGFKNGINKSQSSLIDWTSASLSQCLHIWLCKFKFTEDNNSVLYQTCRLSSLSPLSDWFYLCWRYQFRMSTWLGS